ncbi:hypothetical protein T4E_8039 [Trichinella pseudospiralis]|uniref:Uncharacterized protein n=1 Tax=Trichinella pseudospiralis TaxID=6337 RepID=A0A0V0YCX3_TRIPS|nr:hypothetical protein T4E_8039 [Trichinella pseudospiralis]
MAAFEKDSLKRKADIFLPGFVAQTALAYFSREIADQTFVRCIAPSRKAVKACCPDHCTVEMKFFDFSICAMNKRHWRHKEYYNMVFNDR